MCWNAAGGVNVPAETHVEGEPMERADVLTLVKDRLAEILEIEPSAINEGDAFAEDLDADSLALIELVEGSISRMSARRSRTISKISSRSIGPWLTWVSAGIAGHPTRCPVCRTGCRAVRIEECAASRSPQS